MNPDSRDVRIKFAQQLREQGYDHIPYVNSVEDRGSVSYLVLEPKNLRSRFAEFDPSQKDVEGLGKRKGGSVTDRARMVLSRKA